MKTSVKAVLSLYARRKASGRLSPVGACVLALAALGSSAVAAAATPLYSAVLPSEAPHFGFPSPAANASTFYASLINDSDELLQNCRVEMATELPFILDYQVTERVQNRAVGPANTPAVIAPRALQTFRFTLRLREERYVEQQKVGFRFVCDGVDPAAIVDDINTVLLSAGTPPAAEVLSAIAVASTNGMLQLDSGAPAGTAGSCQLVPYPGGPLSPCAIGAYAFALVNTGNEDIDVDIVESSGMHFSQLCRTNELGICVDTAAPQVALQSRLAAGTSATFSAYLVSLDDFAFNPFVPFQRAGFQVFRGGSNSTGGLLTEQEVRAEAVPFEWSATVDTSGGSAVLRIKGSLWVPSGCHRTSLSPVFEAGIPADELHLELGSSTDHLPDGISCSQAVLKAPVNYESDASIDGYARVIIRHPLNRLVLPIAR